jgi:hypothetical protein
LHKVHDDLKAHSKQQNHNVHVTYLHQSLALGLSIQGTAKKFRTRGDIKHQQKFPSVFARHHIQWNFSYAEGKVKMLDPGGVLGVLFSEIPASFFHYPPSIMAESENKQCTLPQVHLEECLLWEHPAVRLLPYTSILPAPHKIILKRIPV